MLAPVGGYRAELKGEKMRKVSMLLPVILVGMFAAAQQQSVAPGGPDSPAKATIYVYRYKQFQGSALAPSVYCDDTALARMENGRYFAAKIEPGKHVFHSNDKQSGVELEVKAGQEYFLRVEIATGFMKGHGRLVLVSSEQGNYELKSSKLKPLDASKVEDSTRVSVADIQ
ncbi:MAG TPA: DUF2846 domain-containing protein [Terriglobales bacterium]|nr:DUF2846 domain-containing protein [Terriglobales bacterium]